MPEIRNLEEEYEAILRTLVDLCTQEKDNARVRTMRVIEAIANNDQSQGDALDRKNIMESIGINERIIEVLVRLEEDDKEFKKLFNHSVFKGEIYEKLKDADSPEGELLRRYENFFLEFLSDIKGLIRSLYGLLDIQNHALKRTVDKHDASAIFKLELQINETLRQIGGIIDAKYQKLFTELALREGKSSFAVQFVANRNKFSDSEASLWFIVEIVAVIQIYLYGVYHYTIEGPRVTIDDLEKDIPGFKQAAVMAIKAGQTNYERILRGENPEYPHDLHDFCRRNGGRYGINIILIGRYKSNPHHNYLQSFLLDCLVNYVCNSVYWTFKYAAERELEKKVALKQMKIEIALAQAVILGVETASKQHNNYDMEKGHIDYAKKALKSAVNNYDKLLYMEL